MGETAIMREIELALGAEPDVLLLRNNVGVAKHVHERTGRTWHVVYGLGPGSPDLVCIVAPLGRVVGLEVKRPGEKPSEAQLVCRSAWRSFGAVVETVTSVDEARAVLARVRTRGAVRAAS